MQGSPEAAIFTRLSVKEQQKESQQHMTDIGKEVGFKFDYFDGMRMVNTFGAHVLSDKDFGK